MSDQVSFKGVSKIYRTGEVETAALKNVSFGIEKGEFCMITGPSGAGKTTVLNILGGIDRCTRGDVIVSGRNISKTGSDGLTTYRRHAVGFVFQFYNLIPNLTALENVALGSEICRKPLSPKKVLEAVGLADRMNNFPSQLSGGEQQRVAIARAVAKNPILLLCDEPTGALDDTTGTQILSLLQRMNERTGVTVVLITHNAPITRIAKKIICLRNGEVEKIIINENPMRVKEA